MAEGSRFDLSLHQVGRIHVLTSAASLRLGRNRQMSSPRVKGSDLPLKSLRWKKWNLSEGPKGETTLKSLRRKKAISPRLEGSDLPVKSLPGEANLPETQKGVTSP